MDKPRHSQVIRTWKVERIRKPQPPAGPKKQRQVKPVNNQVKQPVTDDTCGKYGGGLLVSAKEPIHHTEEKSPYAYQACGRWDNS